MVCDFRHTDKWVPGTIVQKLGPVTYQVDIGSGNIVKRHIDQLTQRLTPQPVVSETNETQTIEIFSTLNLQNHQDQGQLLRITNLVILKEFQDHLTD